MEILKGDAYVDRHIEICHCLYTSRTIAFVFFFVLLQIKMLLN